jgi:hypothetical protein
MLGQIEGTEEQQHGQAMVLLAGWSLRFSTGQFVPPDTKKAERKNA